MAGGYLARYARYKLSFEMYRFFVNSNAFVLFVTLNILGITSHSNVEYARLKSYLMNYTYSHYTVILLHLWLPLNPEGMSRVTRTWHKIRINVQATLIYDLKQCFMLQIIRGEKSEITSTLMNNLT